MGAGGDIKEENKKLKERIEKEMKKNYKKK